MQLAVGSDDRFSASRILFALGKSTPKMAGRFVQASKAPKGPISPRPPGASSLTIGQVSGLIAVVRITLFLLIGILIAAVLRDENTAATWTVGSSLLQSTPWSTLLRTDAKASTNVSRRVQFLSFWTTFGVLLLGIASIVTPLGLTDEIEPGEIVTPSFKYVPDKSSFGLGTPLRLNGPFTRLCGGLLSDELFIGCPGSSSVDAFETEGGERTIVEGKGDYSTNIPENMTQIFVVDGDKGSKTISGLFDIQYRQYFNRSYEKVNGGQDFVSGVFRSLDTLVLHDKLEVVEGLVVDSVTGGIGYRNHTIPAGLSNGAVWREDITWLEPVTECVDSNLTLDYTIEYDDIGHLSAKDVSLRDHGGFSNLRSKPGTFNTDDVQVNPDLLGRAHFAAWYINGMALIGLNMSTLDNLTETPRNIKPNQNYPVEFGRGRFRPDSLQIASMSQALPGIGLNSSSNRDMEDELSIGGLICEGQLVFKEHNPDSLDKTHVGCGAIYTAPQRSDGGDSMILQPGSKWSQRLYACASSVRASVKTVEFSFNGTASLANLEVSGLQEKKYDDESSMPLWAVEISNQPINQTSRLWGIVDGSHENNPNLLTRRAESVCIPAVYRQQGLQVLKDTVAGASVFGAAMNSIYGTFSESAASWLMDDQQLIADYTGKTNFGFLRKWQSLSANSTSASRIVNLIYTDIVASGTVGTKGLASDGNPRRKAINPGDDDDDNGNNGGNGGRNNGIPVRQYENKIKYNPLYGIPAFFLLLLWLGVLCSALLALIFTRAGTSRITQLLNRLAPGRLVTNITRPGLSHPSAPTKEWANTAGAVKVHLDRISSPADGLLDVGNTPDKSSA
ncbi:hypothetical protein FQN51_003062 [Onygenales sp. PD_10]|nr:hypothetical protein FQN51_003062 [Onygenales sp. PD_10]